MLIKTYVIVALYCPKCDRFDFHAISRFNVGFDAPLHLTCQCGADLFSISREKGNQCAIELACGMCGQRHQYTYPTKYIWREDLINLYCHEIGVKSAFLGSREAVRNAVDDFDNNIGYVETDQGLFNNEEIMNRSLEKIWSLADEGKISCTCGNADLSLDINPDRVEIVCEDCGAVNVFFAENIKDLEIINNLTSVELNKGVFNYIYTSKKKVKNKKIKR